ncbi:MAG: RNA 2',3'-cyclic phosphodiesterase [Peptococcaceae bacterium]|nr:RNA 2',3'-cyclic phosphodiesterase [Peptococcaceae bacterium]
MATMRLFWAIDLPYEVKKKVSEIQQEFYKFNLDAKWVAGENLHLTLKFLGSVRESMVAPMAEAVSQAVASLEPFDLELAGWGTFGRPARVIWIGVGGDLQAFRGLWRVVEEALLPLGFPREEKEFVPHLTLARLRSARGVARLHSKAPKVIARSDTVARFTVDNITLMQSQLTMQGPVYSPVSSIMLT